MAYHIGKAVTNGFGTTRVIARADQPILLRDNFVTSWDAILPSPRSAEPGPGTLTIVDTNNKLSIVGGKLTFATGGAGNGDPAIWQSASRARAAGFAVLAEVTHTSGALYVGLDANQTSVPTEAIVFGSATQLQINSVAGFDVGAIVAGTSYSVACAMRGTGCLFFVKGGAFTNWTLLWVSVTGTDARYPAITSGGTVCVSSSGFLRALQLPSPFTDDYGIATQRLAGARTAGDTFTHEANCVIEWTQTTLPSGGTTQFKFRIQDSTNWWDIIINSSGDLTLREVVNSSATTRGTSAGVIANGDRIVIVADGSTIRVYEANTLRITYASASNFATETDGQITLLGTGGAVSDIVAWPRTITGTAATLLDNAVNGTASSYLLNDEFTTTNGGNLASPRTTEPGPGTLTLVQTDGKFSIVNGKLSFPAQATPTWGDQGFYGTGLARLSGRSLLSVLTKDNAWGSGPMIRWGTSTSLAVAAIDGYAFYPNTTDLLMLDSAGGYFDAGDYTGATEYKIVHALRAIGSFILIKGGSFVSWTLLAVNVSGNAQSVYPQMSNYNGTGTLDTFRVIDLPEPFNSDYGLATNRLAGSVAAGTSFTHTADCVIEWTQTTVPSANSCVVRFRLQDAGNYWRVAVDASGNLILSEVVSGSATVRGSAAAVVANGDRIVVVADGSTIRVYEANTLRITYASATNFATATSGELNTLGTGGAVSDIVAWPRTLSGIPAVVLDNALDIPQDAEEDGTNLIYSKPQNSAHLTWTGL